VGAGGGGGSGKATPGGACRLRARGERATHTDIRKLAKENLERKARDRSLSGKKKKAKKSPPFQGGKGVSGGLRFQVSSLVGLPSFFSFSPKLDGEE
jgi:hypothetical protein